MKRPFPRSLSGQTLAVLVLTLLVSHLIEFIIYSHDRRDAVIRTEAHDFADRVVGMVVLLQHLPSGWREDIVRQSDGRTFHVALDIRPDSAGRDLDEALSTEIARFLKARISGSSDGSVLVRFTDRPFQPQVEPPGLPSAAAADNAEEDGSRLFLHISILQPEGRWLNFVGELPEAPRILLSSASAYIFSVMIVVGAIAMWLVFRVTAPLTTFARAADRLGKDIRAEPLPESGPVEVAQASQAFNAMQARLRRLIENRAQILAALSHDLRTSVTLVRLRVELMGESEEQARVLHTIEEMEVMIASVLEFTKATLLNETLGKVDLTALLGTICEDMMDAGIPVEFDPGERVSYTCRRISLKRALTNLIDNAVKYGGSARVRLVSQGPEIRIEVDDDGPGIPESQREEIFMPFVRIDESRGAAEGGVGLGLSIAQTIIQGHGGQIWVANRAEGGLRVTVSLPG